MSSKSKKRAFQYTVYEPMHTYSQALFISVNFTHFINYKVYARLLVHNLLKYTVRVLWVVARVLLCGCKVVAFF